MTAEEHYFPSISVVLQNCNLVNTSPVFCNLLHYYPISNKDWGSMKGEETFKIYFFFYKKGVGYKAWQDVFKFNL